MAGGNGQGYALNELNQSYELYVDDDLTVYVADFWNHRIVAWPVGAKTGTLVLGGRVLGRPFWPHGLTLDKKDDSFIICDWGNRRLLRWPRQHIERQK